jgi:hypothetical protein
VLVASRWTSVKWRCAVSLLDLLFTLGLIATLSLMSVPLWPQDRTAERLLAAVARSERQIATECSFRAYIETLPIEVPAGFTLALQGEAPISCLRGQVKDRGQRFLHMTATVTTPEGEVSTWVTP